MNQMRKKNNNMRRGGGGGHGGGGRRYHGGGGNGGGGNRNEGQNIQRQKHHATQMREKYSNMARDAQNNGDRVDVEYYLQHVDHYTRVLTDIAAIEAERFASQPQRQHESQPQGQDPAQAGGEATAPAAGNEQGGDQGSSHEPIVQSNQPRMSRTPRHAGPKPQESQPAAAAPGDTDDIPLPGSALTAI